MSERTPEGRGWAWYVAWAVYVAVEAAGLVAFVWGTLER